jgi:hypothetical protein
LCDRQQHVGIDYASLFQNGRMGRIPDQRAQIKPVLQLAQFFGIGIHNRDVVCLVDQAFSHGRTDLPCSKYQYFHADPFIVRA